MNANATGGQSDRKWERDQPGLALRAQSTTWVEVALGLRRSVHLRKSVVIALTYLKTNRRQAEFAENHDTSQSTISRAITGITPNVARALAEFVPTADELDTKRQYVVDGSLLPCWSWRSDPDLYSGKTQNDRPECPIRVHAIR
jgi:hypothetical protein